MSVKNSGKWKDALLRTSLPLEYLVADIGGRIEMLDDIERNFRMIMSIKDGFGDYIIWRDDLNERIEVNKQFESLRSELGHVLTQ